MKKITITTILSLILLPVLLESCHNSVCDCCIKYPDSVPYTMNSIYITVTESGAPARPRLPPKLMELVFTVDPKYLSMRTEHRGTMGAYADCASPVPISKEKFTSLKITSANDLITVGQTFAAGTDLSSQFSMTGFMTGDYMKGLNFSFAPAFTLASEQVHNFTCHFTLDDGRNFELESGSFSLIKE